MTTDVPKEPSSSTRGGGPTTDVLVVAYHFPPIASAGTHRTLQFVRELVGRGHRVSVVTTSTLVGQACDAALLDQVPREVEVVRAPAVDPFVLLWRLRQLWSGRRRSAAGPPRQDQGGSGGAFPRARRVQRGKDFLSRLLTLPDRFASWIPAAFVLGLIHARRVGAKVVYSTAPPYSAHLVASLLQRVAGLAWVADLRDPWATNPFRELPFRVHQKIDGTLEGFVVRRADRVVLNTPAAERAYRSRYPELAGFRTITNGIPGHLLDQELPISRTPRRAGDVRLLHAGTIYGRRWPRGLIEALAALRAEEPEVLARLTIEQLGDVEHRDALLDLAAARGVAEHLVIRDPVPHAEAWARSCDASALLLLGVSGASPEVQVPAKLFEYLAAGRPIVALAKPEGAIAAVLEAAGARRLIADPDSPDQIRSALRRLVSDGLADAPSARPERAARFRYDALARDLERVLLEAQGLRAPGSDAPAAGSSGPGSSGWGSSDPEGSGSDSERSGSEAAGSESPGSGGRGPRSDHGSQSAAASAPGGR